ncbi:hypothetical protein SY83_12340 [Paenibacillus swuensis]|uniref:Uncharacterized protein n=1 Tax=Paenibacillus swuensis TaxID=1178515 RepID=A0A172TJ54_9BACL|nr:hypothetical protein [Paenibacillus swuensis]ANE46934.1 hypothetical protein SY83_12340 [Paenibacillus swuensis]
MSLDRLPSIKSISAPMLGYPEESGNIILFPMLGYPQESGESLHFHASFYKHINPNFPNNTSLPSSITPLSIRDNPAFQFK